MLHMLSNEKYLLIAMCFFYIQPYVCQAEYPTGAIPPESKIQDRFYAGEVSPADLAEVRVVRLSDSLEDFPKEWKVFEKAEEVVITDQGTIAKIVELMKGPGALSDELSSCPAIGALVGKLRNPKDGWVVCFFYAHDDHLMLRSPSRRNSSTIALWRYLKDKYPKLLRPTEGAEVTAKANAQETNVRRIFYRDGTLRTEFPLIHGKYNGIAKNYFKKGQLHIRMPFIDGRLNGITQSYLETGELLEENTYVAGLQHHAQRIYAEDEKLFSTSWFWYGKSVSEEEFKSLNAEAARQQ